MSMHTENLLCRRTARVTARERRGSGTLVKNDRAISQSALINWAEE